MAFRGFHTVTVFDCPPFQMFTNADDPVSEHILRGHFETHSMRLWCRLVRVASSILDIGAHVGAYSLAAAAIRKDIEIHAFEPNPFTAARLRVNKHLNDFQHITEHNIALAEAHGIAEVTWITKPNGWLSSGSGLGPERERGWQRAPVYVETLDSRGVSPGPLPLIKMDVEGAEYNVFRGMTKFLQARPIVILETFSPHACEYINSQLSDYRFFLIDEDGYLEPREQLIACSLADQNKNYLLCPKEHSGRPLSLA